MRHGWCAALICAALLAGCGRKEDVVAEVDGKGITVGEFRTRYEQFLRQGSKRDNILLRKEVLNNMINERLIMLDVAHQGFDSDEAYRRRMRVVETQALLDRYAKAISFDTLTISEAEGRDEFRRLNTIAGARYLYARTREGAMKLKQRLGNGETFESLAREVFEDPGLAGNGGYLGTFGWGEMEPALEEAAFSLAVGAISDPVKLNIGYAIVKVESRVVQPLVSEHDYAKVKQKLADRIQERKIAQLVRSEAENVSKSLVPVFNEQAVTELFKNWGILAGRVEADFEADVTMPSDISTMKLMEFSRGTWTIRDFVERADWTTESQRRRVKSPDDVKDIALGLATREVLIEKARSKGLEDDSAVVAQVTRLRERYVLRRWGNSVHDTVGNSGWAQALLDSMFEANKEHYAYPPEVNVAEILVRTEEEAAKLKRRAQRGEDFGELARKHSIRLWAAKQGGELGFGQQASFGPMGDVFFAARVGEIIGPGRVDPYWGVFKIVGRREGRRKTFEEARPDIIAALLPARKQRASATAIAGLRSRAAVAIHEETLARIEIDVDNNERR